MPFQQSDKTLRGNRPCVATNKSHRTSTAESFLSVKFLLEILLRKDFIIDVFLWNFWNVSDGYSAEHMCTGSSEH